MLMIGDLNGHVGFLGTKAINENGKMVIDWIEKENLILLNGDMNCEGWNMEPEQRKV